MATNTLDVRLILKGDTAANWAKSTLPILKNELCIETDTRKMKIGEDGVKTYKDLKYANLTPEEVNSLISAASHTHSNKSVLDATTASFTTALLTKLNGIAEGANKTIVDSALSSTSTNPVQNKVIDSALNGKVPTNRTINGKALTGNITLTSADVSAIAANLKGAANGVAELGPDGKVPAAQLPSYVDDVLEGYLSGGKFYKESAHTTEIAGESGKIYMNLANGLIYRWSGSAYAEVSQSLALGTTSSTAFRGDYGNTAYQHSQAAHAPSNAERNIIVGVQRNGTDVTVDSTTRKVNITVPTKTSEITNDSDFVNSKGTIANATHASQADNATNATSASKAVQLTNARNFSITGGATAANVSFNGTANVTLNVTALNTDYLKNGTSTLVLNCGSSAV